MKNKRIIIFTILLAAVICSYGQAGEVIDFGELTPEKEIVREEILQIPLTLETAVLELMLEAKFLSTSANQNLSGQRIKVKGGVEEQFLNAAPLQISRDEFRVTSDMLSLPISITLLPGDNPGEYRGNLIVKQLNSEGEEVGVPIKTEMIVKINPWLIIKQIEGREIMMVSGVDYRSRNVFSKGIPVLKVASNTSWKLYAFLDPDNQLRKNSVKIEVPLDSKYYTGIKDGGFYLGLEPKVIAVGNKTTNKDNCWVEIPIKLVINDFTRLKAGRIRFPVNFSAVYFN